MWICYPSLLLEAIWKQIIKKYVNFRAFLEYPALILLGMVKQKLPRGQKFPLAWAYEAKSVFLVISGGNSSYSSVYWIGTILQWGTCLVSSF